MDIDDDKYFESELRRRIEKEFPRDDKEYWFNQVINCGGYALKADICVWLGGENDFSKIVSSILKKFTFVRLIGEKPLAEDEYLVFYRADANGIGHHFVRVESDGTIVEKNNCYSPKNFEGWDDHGLEDAPEAVFAVKKNHNMFDYHYSEIIGIRDEEGVFNFEEEVDEAIKNRRNNFNYHGHDFGLKKATEEDAYVVSNGEIVADVVIGDGDIIVEIKEAKKDYVENLKGLTKPIIKDGKLVNLDDFKKQKKKDDKSVELYDYDVEL